MQSEQGRSQACGEKRVSDEPLRIAIVGLSGFAAAHHRAVRDLEAEGRSCILTACCIPPGGESDELAAELELEARGVHIYPSLDALLTAEADALDLITLPVPIPLHAPMHRACVEAGVPCYLEKPPSTHIGELDDMLAVEAGAREPTFVGFNFIGEQARRDAKQRIVEGAFGPLERVTYLGLWARNTAYYARTSWAGRLFLNDYPVLDGVLGNAMSHFVFAALYWAGTDAAHSWAHPTAVRAVCGRANAIESPDTMFVTAHTDTGVELRLAGTHACEEGWVCEEELVCRDATLQYKVNGTLDIAWRDGRHESIDVPVHASMHDNLRQYLDVIRGNAPRPLISLANTRPFVQLYDLAWLSAGRVQVAPSAATRPIEHAESGTTTVTLPGIADVARRFVREGIFPDAQGVDWLVTPAATTTPGHLSQWDACLARLRNQVRSGSDGTPSR